MGDALRVDELWAPTSTASNAAQHLETNGWLAPFIPTTAGGPKVTQGPVALDFLGHKILWTVDRDRPFPKWVKEALIEMLTFAELPNNWDSYGGRHLQNGAVGPALHLIMAIHGAGRTARLVPLPDGGIGLRLVSDARNLEIDVCATGGIEASLEAEGAGDVEIGPDGTIADAMDLLGQFLA